ncbi:MAG: hypothetical protein U9Q30_07895 [Campylobacterota bacterium]|nr:hypothetical protein [Campylobacterota bacterium]
MKKEEIIDFLKNQYPRDVRKQLVKSILNSEKIDDKNGLKQQLLVLNQILSYILKECNWDIPKGSTEINKLPLEIMVEVFPKINTTKWFEEQVLSTKQNIQTVINK